jgi:hypothetical protein
VMAMPPESIVMNTCARFVAATSARKFFAMKLNLLADFRISAFQFAFQAFRTQATCVVFGHRQGRQLFAPAIAFRRAIHQRMAA